MVADFPISLQIVKTACFGIFQSDLLKRFTYIALHLCTIRVFPCYQLITRIIDNRFVVVKGGFKFGSHNLSKLPLRISSQEHVFSCVLVFFLVSVLVTPIYKRSPIICTYIFLYTWNYNTKLLLEFFPVLTRHIQN